MEPAGDSIDHQNKLNSEIFQENENNDIVVDSSISSSSVTVTGGDGIEIGGHILRRRVPDGDSWRELSKTPSPTRSRSSSTDAKQKRSQRINIKKTPSKSFEEYTKAYDEMEKRKPIKGDTKQKTIDDFHFKGFKKRNLYSRISYKMTDLYHQLMNSRSMQIITIFLVIIALVAGGMLFYRTLRPTTIDHGLTETEQSAWRKAQKSLLRQLVKLNDNFPSQNQETAIHFVSAINSTLSEKVPKQPSAVTILTPPSMSDSTFPACFVSKIASIVNSVFSRVSNLNALPVKVLNKSYFTNNGQNITAIHEDLKSYLNEGGKAVLVHNVEQLDREEHLLFFHSFCDNFNAPDKRATFFFLLPVPLRIHQKHPWNQMFAADISNDVLNQAWQNAISDDSRPAMISRVAATVVLLNEGDIC